MSKAGGLTHYRVCGLLSYLFFFRPSPPYISIFLFLRCNPIFDVFVPLLVPSPYMQVAKYLSIAHLGNATKSQTLWSNYLKNTDQIAKIFKWFVFVTLAFFCLGPPSAQNVWSKINIGWKCFPQWTNSIAMTFTEHFHVPQRCHHFYFGR